jgi:hypothetical protein
MLTKDDIFQFEHWFSAMTVVKKKLGRLIDRRGRVSRFVVNYSDLVAGTSVKIGSTEWDTIPAGATIRRVYYRNVVAMAGDGNSASTLAVGLNTSNDVLAATACSNAALTGTTGTKDAIPVDTAATRLVLASDSRLGVTLTIAGTDTKLTAGQIYVYVAWDPIPVVFG